MKAYARMFCLITMEKRAVLTPFNTKHFDMWYGDKFMEAHSIDEVMKTPFFDGKALGDIVDQLENVEGM